MMDPISDMTVADFSQYLDEEEKSAATIDKYIRDVKALFEILRGPPCYKRNGPVLQGLASAGRLRSPEHQLHVGFAEQLFHFSGEAGAEDQADPVTAADFSAGGEGDDQTGIRTPLRSRHEEKE